MMDDEPTVEALEDQVQILRQQVEAVAGTSKEIGALMSLRHGVTRRIAIMLFLLVKRAPAVVSNSVFHSVIYADRIDGGPDPKIFAIHICRLRKIMKRLEIPGKIDTVWNAGYRADPKLVAWVNKFYADNIEED